MNNGSMLKARSPAEKYVLVNIEGLAVISGAKSMWSASIRLRKFVGRDRADLDM
jgi:hypothetical protein